MTQLQTDKKPECPICHGEAETGYLLGGDAQLRWVPGDATLGATLRALALGQGKAVGDIKISKGGSYASGVYCPKCRKIIIPE